MDRNQPGTFDWLVKLLVIGDAGVGKTNILSRFCKDTFSPAHQSTIGIDFYNKPIQIDGKVIKLQVWDTAGQEKYRTIVQTYYKGAMGIVLAYSINERESFVNVLDWMSQIQQHASEDVVKILVGNKCDMADRQVTYEEGKEFAEQHNIMFFETSAKENINITETFMAISNKIKDRLITEDNQPNLNNSAGNKKGTKLQANASKSKSKKNCC